MGGGAGGGALLDAATRGDAPLCVATLAQHPPHIHCTDEIGRTALQRAAAEGHVDVVQVLLQHGADPNKQDFVYGNTAAHEASWKGYSMCVRLLARAGAELRALNAAGFTPLHFACQNGHNQSCREALLAGAPPDLHNTYGDTPLHTAARYGHAGVTRILISAQCSVSEQNRNGDTALHIAAAMARRKLTRILLEAGCDKSIKNLQGETARDIATRKGLEEIIQILNTPVSKQSKKKRDKSKERVLDEPDSAKKRDKSKEKKKKNVHFEKPPQVPWSPYGCHYYPDTKFFPKPKLSSLPSDPLRKGEQYYLDLAGNIKKGPIGAGYTCYCAPFFKHMEEKLNEDKKDLKRHIDRAHERIDQKVTDLEMKTQGQISELTRFVAAERAMCKERHKHLEHWLTRGMMFRASERVKKLEYSPKGSVDIPPLKRTRSLEVLDTEEWNRVHRIIKSFNKNCEQYDSHAKDLNDSKATSKSTDVLDMRSPSPRRQLKNSQSSDNLDAGPSRRSRSPRKVVSPDGQKQNVTAEIHVKSNRVSVSQSPVSMEVRGYIPKYTSPTRQPTQNLARTSNNEAEEVTKEPGPSWRSQVLQKTADDIRKRAELDKEMSEVLNRNSLKLDSSKLDISQDGYVKLRKHQEDGVERGQRKSVQELVAQVEQQRCQSPDPISAPIPVARKQPTDNMDIVPPPPPPASILKMPQQPQRPAPVLKEKPPKSKRFSLHNLIPFPTRKTFHPPPKDNGNQSESSDEEDNPIRSTTQPSPLRNSLLQTLPLPNYEAVNKSPSPSQPSYTDSRPAPPKDAYFHEIPNRQMPYREVPYQYDYNQTGLPQVPRNRNPVYQTGNVFDAMMQDHIMREMERIPHCYSERLDQNTEVEIANDNFRMYYDNPPYYRQNLKPDHNMLHNRLQSLAINTHLTETQSQTDRESHNDSGYSTKVYGSSQGPSPSLSGHVEGSDRGMTVLPNGKAMTQVGSSSLV